MSTEQLSDADKARLEELQKKRKDTGGHLTDSERLDLTALVQKETAAKEAGKAGKEEQSSQTQKGQQKIK